MGDTYDTNRGGAVILQKRKPEDVQIIILSRVVELEQRVQELERRLAAYEQFVNLRSWQVP